MTVLKIKKNIFKTLHEFLDLDVNRDNHKFYKNIVLLEIISILLNKYLQYVFKGSRINAGRTLCFLVQIACYINAGFSSLHLFSGHKQIKVFTIGVLSFISLFTFKLANLNL